MKRKVFWGYWLFWGFLTEFIVLTLMVPARWMDQSLGFEARRIEQVLGEDTARWIARKANGKFQARFMDSGFYKGLHLFLIPTEAEKQQTRTRTPALEKVGRLWFDWLEARLEVMMRVFYQLCVRMALLFLWWPWGLLAGVPALWDGWMTRRIKRTNFDYVSPVLHRYGMRGVWGLGVGLLMAFIAPIPLEPTLIPAALMAGCVLAGLVLGNLQKRI